MPLRTIVYRVEVESDFWVKYHECVSLQAAIRRKEYWKSKGREARVVEVVTTRKVVSE